MHEPCPSPAWSAWVGPEMDALLAEVGRSPFHAQRCLASPGGGPPRLEDFPPLDKAPWLEASPPYATEALTAPLEEGSVFRTGGTSGTPCYALFTAQEVEATAEALAEAYRMGGLRPGDRVANCFAAGALYASFVFVDRALARCGVVSFPFAASADPEAVAQAAEAWGIEVLVGFPSWLRRVGEAMKARGLRLKRVMFGGEPMGQADRAFWASLGAEVSSAGYAAVDAGLVAAACPSSPPTDHHVLTPHAWVELLDEGTLEAVKGSGPGLIVATNLIRRLHPVLRFVVGDRGAWLPGPCPCGDPRPKFRLLGRAGESLRLGIATLTAEELSQAIAPWVGDAPWQATRWREEGRDRLRLGLELEQQTPGLAARLAEALLAAKPDMAKAIAAGALHPPEILLGRPGSLPRDPRTGKLRRMVDATD